MAGPIGMEEKGCELMIMNDHDRCLWVITVGYVDIQDSDQGDFRCRHAIKSFSFWAGSVNNHTYPEGHETVDSLEFLHAMVKCG